MMDPVGFTSEYAKNWSLPSHIVLYEPEEKLLREFLVSHSFRQVNSGTLPGVNSVHISTTRSFCLCSWVLTSYIYRKKRFFHAHFKVDRDLQALVSVYVLTDQ